ncbi:MAG TPA: chemotaxis protein CheX [Candidatus Ozemobacteraceae bacterium]|nr:chemotaxis protein CheX [Candidatus Ozemobacteraceae bacterium]
MDAKILNAFVGSLLDVFDRGAQMKLEKTKVSALPPQSRLKVEVASILGITGDIKGQMVMLTSEQIIMKCTSAILMGIEVTEFNEMAESGACEMLNMVAGDASQKIGELGYKFDISPPSVIHGNAEVTFPGSAPVFLIELKSDLGPVLVAITLEVVKK